MRGPGGVGKEGPTKCFWTRPRHAVANICYYLRYLVRVGLVSSAPNNYVLVRNPELPESGAAHRAGPPEGPENGQGSAKKNNNNLGTGTRTLLRKELGGSLAGSY